MSRSRTSGTGRKDSASSTVPQAAPRSRAAAAIRRASSATQLRGNASRMTTSTVTPSAPRPAIASV
jgi:hypothetical protein